MAGRGLDCPVCGGEMLTCYAADETGTMKLRCWWCPQCNHLEKPIGRELKITPDVKR